MAPRNRGSRPTLRQGLDREVYQVVRKIVDDQIEKDQIRLSVSVIYDSIKRSNSSLNRKPKKLLEDSVERVLEVVKADVLGEDDEDDSIEGDFEGLAEQPPPESNGLNRSIIGMWNTDANSKPPKQPDHNGAERTPTNGPTSTKRRQAAGESHASKRRKADTDRSPPTHVSLTDLGGLDDVIQDLGDLVILPMTRPQVYLSSNVQPPRGVLLHGPPGCGKTMIANAFAAELGVPFISISAPSIVSGMSGESEKALREHFDEARRLAPCLVFIDEIDAITPKRESAQREMEKRIVAQLLTCLDDLTLEKTDGKPVIVLAATNRPDSLDPALRRGGRFDKEINMTVPSEPVREQILRALTRKMSLADDLDLKALAKRTPGFVGADLNDLVSTAGSMAIKRYLEILKAGSGEEMEIEGADELNPKIRELRRLIAHAKESPVAEEAETVLVSNADFFAALPKIQPSSKREGFATIPDTTWADIGALSEIRDELSQAIVEPIKNPEIYANVGISAPTGVLLWGPPGCGKTILAKAVANESRANFISVKGPELLNKYVGESERAVRQVFVRARSSVPCVIFFDELDALVPRRDDTLSEASARVVNTLLTELDGLGSSRNGIYVIAATNRPDTIDPAMLRPGRLDQRLFVNLPSALERGEILRTLVRHLPIEFSEDLRKLAEDCEGYSGADMGSLLRRAGYIAIKRRETIQFEDFVAAKQVIRPSVSDMKKYEKIRREWRSAAV